MTIRGKRSAHPGPMPAEQNVFSSPQKKDPVNSHHDGVLKYALSGGGESRKKPKGGAQGLRTNGPNGGNSKMRKR